MTTTELEQKLADEAHGKKAEPNLIADKSITGLIKANSHKPVREEKLLNHLVP